MRILELTLRNYRVFEQVDLELPARVIGIFGANGSGKSSLVGSIMFALYGVDRTSKDQIRTQGVLTDCEVRLVFQHGVQQYEVRRLIRGKNHQVEAELLVGDASLAVGVREVDAEVRRVLKMDQQVFRSSVFAEQKQLDAFSDLTKTRRKEMVLRLLGIKPVDDARTAARKAARERKGDADRLAGTLPDLAEQEQRLTDAREALAKAAGGAAEAKERLAAADKELVEVGGAFEASEASRQEAEKLAGLSAAAAAEANRLAARRADIEERIEKLRQDLAALPALEEEAEGLAGARDLMEAAGKWAEASEELRAAEAALGSAPEVDGEAAVAALEEALRGLRAAEAAALRAEAASEQADRDLARARASVEKAGKLDPTEPCPTCGQALGEAFRDVVAHHEAEAKELGRASKAASAEAKKTETARATAEKAFAAAQTAGEEARVALDRRAALEKETEKLAARAAKLAEPFGGDEPDVEALRDRAARAAEIAELVTGLRAEAKHAEHAANDLAGAEKELAAAEARINELEAKREQLAFDPKAHAALRARFSDATEGVEQARRDEREASDAEKDVAKQVAGLEKAIEQVKEIQGRVGELKDEARYSERVSLLLDGFRDHLVSRIGPELSREAEAIFRELTNHEYDDLKIDEEDLSIQIADGASWFPIERFSGSETDLANLALRVAISTHLSRVSGADLGMMVLDEVLASLDAERKDLMIQTLGRLANRFHQLFVITHAEQVKDQLPASIEVRKVGRRRSEAALV